MASSGSGRPHGETDRDTGRWVGPAPPGGQLRLLAVRGPALGDRLAEPAAEGRGQRVLPVVGHRLRRYGSPIGTLRPGHRIRRAATTGVRGTDSRIAGTRFPRSAQEAPPRPWHSSRAGARPSDGRCGTPGGPRARLGVDRRKQGGDRVLRHRRRSLRRCRRTVAAGCRSARPPRDPRRPDRATPPSRACSRPRLPRCDARFWSAPTARHPDRDC
jgi:hypothetical protein